MLTEVQSLGVEKASSNTHISSRTPRSSPNEIELHEHNATMDAVRTLRDSGKLTDVTICCGQQKFKVHSVIISA